MTDSVPAPRIPYGTWPSPITAADVAKGRVLISYPMVIGTDVWWQEGRPDEGGRVTLVHCDADGSSALLPAPWNARSRVHEYGGRSYLPVPGAAPGGGGGGRVEPDAAAGGAIVFVNYADQRLYLAAGDRRDPGPLTPAPARRARRLRFADFILSPDGQGVVRPGAARRRQDHPEPGGGATGRERGDVRRPSVSWSAAPIFSPSRRCHRMGAGWPGSAGITRGCPGMGPNCGWPRFRGGAGARAAG